MGEGVLAIALTVSGLVTFWLAQQVWGARGRISCMAGMMIAMTAGMLVSLLAGVVAAAALPGSLWPPTAVAMGVGLAVGMGMGMGLPVSLMAVLDGALSQRPACSAGASEHRPGQARLCLDRAERHGH